MHNIIFAFVFVTWSVDVDVCLFRPKYDVGAVLRSLSFLVELIFSSFLFLLFIAFERVRCFVSTMRFVLVLKIMAACDPLFSMKGLPPILLLPHPRGAVLYSNTVYGFC